MGFHSFKTLQWNELVIYWRVVDCLEAWTFSMFKPSEFCCQCLPIPAWELLLLVAAKVMYVCGGFQLCSLLSCIELRISTDPRSDHLLQIFCCQTLRFGASQAACLFTLSDKCSQSWHAVNGLENRRQKKWNAQSFRCVITWRLNVYLSKLSVATWKSIRLRPQITNCHWNAMKYMKASSSEVSCQIHQLLHMEGV